MPGGACQEPATRPSLFRHVYGSDFAAVWNFPALHPVLTSAQGPGPHRCLRKPVHAPQMRPCSAAGGTASCTPRSVGTLSSWARRDPPWMLADRRWLHPASCSLHRERPAPSDRWHLKPSSGSQFVATFFCPEHFKCRPHLAVGSAPGVRRTENQTTIVSPEA